MSPLLTALAVVTPPSIRHRFRLSTLAMSRGRCVECARRVRTRRWDHKIEHGHVFTLHRGCAAGRRSWRHTTTGEIAALTAAFGGVLALTVWALASAAVALVT